LRCAAWRAVYWEPGAPVVRPIGTDRHSAWRPRVGRASRPGRVVVAGLGGGTRGEGDRGPPLAPGRLAAGTATPRGKRPVERARGCGRDPAPAPAPGVRGPASRPPEAAAGVDHAARTKAIATQKNA